MSILVGGTGFSGVWYNVYIIRKFVEMLKDELLYARFSEPAEIPENAGGYVARWNIPQRFLGTVTARTEASSGTTGELTSVAINKVESTINTYYDWMKIGEISEKSMIDGTMDVFYEQFTFAGTAAIDLLLYAEAKKTTTSLTSGATATATGAGTAATSTSIATIRDFPLIANYFFGGNARGFKELRGDFVWIMHPSQELKLATEFTTTALAWTDVHQYTETGYGQLFDKLHMIGRFAGVTALRTTLIGTATLGNFVFQSHALAKYGLGWAGLGESGPRAPEIIYKKPGPNDTSQPANMYSTLAWKVKLAAALTDAARVITVYSYSLT